MASELDIRPRGRPRRAETEAAILRATAKLLASQKVAEITIERIAAEARVGRPTVYRRWSTKAAVVVDAFLKTAESELAVDQSYDADAMLRQQISLIVDFAVGRQGEILAEIIGEAQSDLELLATFRDRFILQRRLATKTLIQAGIKSGKFRSDLDLEFAIDLIAAPVYYRLLVRHQPINPSLADEIIAAFERYAS